MSCWSPFGKSPNRWKVELLPGIGDKDVLGSSVAASLMVPEEFMMMPGLLASCSRGKGL